MTIKSYANSATKDFMERRESHFLCVIPGSNTSLLGNLLRLGKQYHLNLARVITANATLDIANGIAVRPGDILLEQVSTSVVDSSEVIRALKASGPGINISQQSSQGITVSFSFKILQRLSYILHFNRNSMILLMTKILLLYFRRFALLSRDILHLLTARFVLSNRTY